MDDYVDATGHDYVEGTCTECGEEDPDYWKEVVKETIEEIVEVVSKLIGWLIGLCPKP